MFTRHLYLEKYLLQLVIGVYWIPHHLGFRKWEKTEEPKFYFIDTNKLYSPLFFAICNAPSDDCALCSIVRVAKWSHTNTYEHIRTHWFPWSTYLGIAMLFYVCCVMTDVIENDAIFTQTYSINISKIFKMPEIGLENDIQSKILSMLSYVIN